MTEKSLQELEREKLEWEIRALKHSARPRGLWLGLLFLLNLIAWVYIGSQLLEVNRDDAQSRIVEMERMLLSIETKEAGMALLQRDLDQRENELLEKISLSEVSSKEHARQIGELKEQIEGCQALSDKTWEQRVLLLEALDRIDEVWKRLPETMTFGELRKLRGVEEQLIEMRSILEDIEAPE